MAETRTEPGQDVRCKQYLLSDVERQRIESRNALQQFRGIIEMIDSALSGGVSFSLKPDHLLKLNYLATLDTTSCPGEFRDGRVYITDSSHRCADPGDIESLVADMCRYINEAWPQRKAVHLAAFLLWRLNAIHPFVDGNGRTSRAVCYAVLCIKLGYHLPGTPTIPTQISLRRDQYVCALREADAAWKKGALDVSGVETMLMEMLAIQLGSVIVEASS